MTAQRTLEREARGYVDILILVLVGVGVVVIVVVL